MGEPAKTAIITGASAGIGKATRTGSCARAGNVALAGRRAELLDAAIAGEAAAMRRGEASRCPPT